MNSYVVLLFSMLFLLVMTLKGTKKQYAKISSESYFSRNQTNWLRGLATIGIAYSHYLPKLDINNSYYWQVGFLGIFGVAIFLFLSGYSAMISLINKPNYLKGYLPKRFSRLYIPFFILFVMYSIFLCFVDYKFSLINVLDLFIISLPGITNWYLKVQFALYILFFIYAKLIKNKKILLLVVYLTCFIYMIIGFKCGIDNFWYQSCYMFPLGMTFANYKDTIFRFLNFKYWLKLILSFVLFLLAYVPVYIIGGVISEIIFVLAFIQFMIVACVSFSGSSILATFFGKYSLEFYLSHTIILSLFNYFYHENENILSFLIFIISSVLLAIIDKKISLAISKKLNL